MFRKRMVLKITLLACMALALVSLSRADDDNIIAGILSGNPGCDEYAFDSAGGQIFFAEAGAEFYQSKGRSSGGGCGDDGTPHDEGGCGDDGTSHDEGGCGCGDSTAGPNDLCLQVVDSAGGKICWAGRPIRPGWQRDPRLACHLESQGNYSLRVFRGQCGSTTACEVPPAAGAPGSSPTLYLLRARLVDVEDSEGKLFPPVKK